MAIVMVMTLLPTSALAAGGDTGLQEGQVRATKALVLNDENQPAVDAEGYYTVQITVQGKPKQAENGSNADVVLVVDNSGSMSSSVGEPCNTPKDQFAEKNEGLWYSYTCPNCGAEYSKTLFWDTRPEYCTGQKGNTPRIDAAKDVSKEFANSILAEGTDNKLAVIGFAHNKDNGGVDDKALTVSQELTTDKSLIDTKIDQMKADGGTNYTAALAKAQEYLNNRTDTTRPGYVIFISDGAPGRSGDSLNDSNWNGSTQIEQLKTAGITVYTVGIALEADAENYLKNMASENQDEHFINVSTTKYKDEMSAILQTWATKINSIPAGRDATITDVVNTGEFEYKMVGTPSNVTNENGTVIWNIGTITEEPQSIRFKVKPKADNYGKLYTNESVELSYTNCDGEKKQIKDTKKTAKPQIGDPYIEIANPARAYTVEYYYNGKKGAVPAGAPTSGTANVGDTVTISAGDNADATHFPKKTTVDTENYAFDEGAENVLSVTIGAEQENILKVYYASDKNEDGTPDKYQATVTFKVVNGSWNDGSTNDQKRTVTLYEKNATTGVWTLRSEADRTINVPTGMKPATGYVENSGAWNDKAITDGKVVVAADATYTYTFNAMNQYTVTVNYLIENTTTQLKSSYSTTVSHGAAYDVTAQVPATLTYGEKNDNYVKVSSDAETGNASGNVIINVYYALDNWKDAEQTEDEDDKDSLTGGDGIPDKYQALVKFESADATKGTVAGTGAVQVFTFKNAEGEYLTSGNVTPSLANVTTTPADGFAFDIWTKDGEKADPSQLIPNVNGGTTIIFKANWKSNVVTITFDANGGAWAAAVDGYTMGAENKTASKKFKPSDTVEKITPNPANGTKKFVGWGINADATEPLSLLALSPQAAKLKELTEGTGTLYAIWEDAAQPTEKLNYTIHQHYIGSNGKQDAQFNDELPKTASAGTKISDLIPAELQKNRKYYYQTYIYLSSETKIVNDNVATPVADDTVLNKDNTQIHLYYYLDAWNDENNTLTGGDNIPDKYQAVVTYKVVGGTWKDGKTDDQVQVFTLKTNNKETGVWEDANPAPVLGDTIPTGMISKYSRTASQSWDKDITKDTKVTESVTYTYTFTKGSSGGGGGSSSTHYYISLKKVDAQDGEALSGAKFGLYLDGKQIATATSDRNGIVRFSMGSSNYRSLTDKSNLYCQELTAPEGYKLSNEKIAVSKKDVSTSSSTSDKNAKTVKNSRSKTPSMLNGEDHFAYIVGYPDKTVHPQSSITRAEVATIFFRLLTEETRTANATKTNKYADVSSDKWYNQAVSTLSAMGIIKGDSRGNFNPNAPITRAEFAAIAARFDKTENVAAASFGDVATHWAKPEISVAANNGWINGYTDGTFHPDSRITRAEAMAMINRVLQRLPESKADLLDGMIQWSDNADTSKWYYLAVQEATNSHYYELKANQHEKWTKLRENRDWTELEK